MEEECLEITDKRKRKRAGNTSIDQYETYLVYMENDYILRSCTINPTVDPKYLDKKWVELTNNLNSSGSGPKLSVEEWKKRFNDWKNATRAKYRKLCESRLRTGGGPSDNIKMTSTEERGLAVWGKVTVAGTPYIQESGGLQRPCTSFTSENVLLCANKINTENEEYFIDTEILENNQDTEILQIIPENMEQTQVLQDTTNVEENSNRQTPKRKIFKKQKPKSLTNAANIITTYCENNLAVQKAFNENLAAALELYKETEREKMEIERQKLKFAIAKYKYENAGFDFEL